MVDGFLFCFGFFFWGGGGDGSFNQICNYQQKLVGIPQRNKTVILLLQSVRIGFPQGDALGLP